ncbi:hypothetical protein SDJN02_06011, partial [Cucurbita argyrosperma subsp. argyrosperma]
MGHSFKLLARAAFMALCSAAVEIVCGSWSVVCTGGVVTVRGYLIGAQISEGLRYNRFLLKEFSILTTRLYTTS